jgi:hypothetical protein
MSLKFLRFRGTSDPLAPAQVGVGPAVGSSPRNPMFKRLFEWARSVSDGRSRDGLVH